MSLNLQRWDFSESVIVLCLYFFSLHQMYCSSRFSKMNPHARIMITFAPCRGCTTDVFLCVIRLLPPTVPEFSLLPSLVTDSFTVAIVGFSMGISLAKIFALKHGYSVDGNQVSENI